MTKEEKQKLKDRIWVAYFNIKKDRWQTEPYPRNYHLGGVSYPRLKSRACKIDLRQLHDWLTDRSLPRNERMAL